LRCHAPESEERQAKKHAANRAIISHVDLHQRPVPDNGTAYQKIGGAFAPESPGKGLGNHNSARASRPSRTRIAIVLTYINA
jgi:hypothetical protein